MTYTLTGHPHIWPGRTWRATWDAGQVTTSPDAVLPYLRNAAELSPSVGPPTGPFYRAKDWSDPAAFLWLFREVCWDVTGEGDIPTIPYKAGVVY